MMKVTRPRDAAILLKVEKIQSVQATPDTVITFTNHAKIIVKEPDEVVSQLIVEYHRAIKQGITKSGET